MRKKILAALLAALLLVTPFAVAGPAEASSVEERLKEEKSKLETQLAAVRSNMDGLKEKNKELEGKLGQLKDEGKAAEADYERLTQEMDKAQAHMEEAVAKTEEAVKNVNDQQQAYEDRLVSLFQYRNKSTLEVLFESDSLDGFFTKMRLMAYVADADTQLLENLKTAREDAEVKQAEADKTLAEYKDFMANKEDQLAKLAVGISLAEQDVRDNKEEIDSAAAEAGELEVHIDAFEAELNAFYEEQRRQYEAAQAAAAARKREAEEAARSSSEAKAKAEEAERLAREKAEQAKQAPEDSKAREDAENARKLAEEKAEEANKATEKQPEESVSEPSQGRLICPLSSYQYISSPYGPRVHPITGARDGFHYGVDFSAPFGTPIRAAKGGTVRIASARYQGQNYTSHKSGYGNYVTIDHGDGTSTTYAHMKYVEVSQGQSVSAGTRIGQVGSTGASTGAHLHFEYAIYGQTTNPLNYID